MIVLEIKYKMEFDTEKKYIEFISKVDKIDNGLYGQILNSQSSKKTDSKIYSFLGPGDSHRMVNVKELKTVSHENVIGFSK